MKVIVIFIISVFAAFFLNLVSLAILGSTIGFKEVQELLGGNNSLPLFVFWWATIITSLMGTWVYKKYVARDVR